MPSEVTYQQNPDPKPSAVKEQDIEESFIQKLRDLKYTDRPDILQRMVFDGEQLAELLAPLGLNWKSRRLAELALMEALVPLLKKRAAGREISGLNAYES